MRICATIRTMWIIFIRRISRVDVAIFSKHIFNHFTILSSRCLLFLVSSNNLSMISQVLLFSSYHGTHNSAAYANTFFNFCNFFIPKYQVCLSIHDMYSSLCQSGVDLSFCLYVQISISFCIYFILFTLIYFLTHFDNVHELEDEYPTILLGSASANISLCIYVHLGYVFPFPRVDYINKLISVERYSLLRRNLLQLVIYYPFLIHRCYVAK